RWTRRRARRRSAGRASDPAGCSTSASSTIGGGGVGDESTLHLGWQNLGRTPQLIGVANIAGCPRVRRRVHWRQEQSGGRGESRLRVLDHAPKRRGLTPSPPNGYRD